MHIDLTYLWNNKNGIIFTQDHTQSIKSFLKDDILEKGIRIWKDLLLKMITGKLVTSLVEYKQILEKEDKI